MSNVSRKLRTKSKKTRSCEPSSRLVLVGSCGSCRCLSSGVRKMHCKQPHRIADCTSTASHQHWHHELAPFIRQVEPTANERRGSRGSVENTRDSFLALRPRREIWGLAGYGMVVLIAEAERDVVAQQIIWRFCDFIHLVSAHRRILRPMADLAGNQLQMLSCACNNGERQKCQRQYSWGRLMRKQSGAPLCWNWRKTIAFPISLARIDLVKSQRFEGSTLTSAGLRVVSCADSGVVGVISK